MSVRRDPISTVAESALNSMRNHIDNHMKSKFSHATDRLQRAEELERTMAKMNLAPEVKLQMQARFESDEDKHAADRRKKMSVLDFETLTIIGK